MKWLIYPTKAENKLLAIRCISNLISHYCVVNILMNTKYYRSKNAVGHQVQNFILTYWCHIYIACFLLSHKVISLFVCDCISKNWNKCPSEASCPCNAKPWRARLVKLPIAFPYWLSFHLSAGYFSNVSTLLWEQRQGHYLFVAGTILMLFKSRCSIFPVSIAPCDESIISLWRMYLIHSSHAIKAKCWICWFIVVQPGKYLNQSGKNERPGWFLPKFLLGNT